MQRRKFIAGVGSLAAGAAAAMGTGAFTSVTADRSVDVNVTGDASAYLGLAPADGPNGAYAEDNGDTVSVNFDGLNDGESSSGNVTDGGSGVNPNATTDVDGVLEITNQGTQEVSVTLTDNAGSDVTVSLAGNSTLGVGQSVLVDFEIDTNPDNPDLGGTLTIEAEATS